MVQVYFTFIRHGESTDNLRSIWAGWRDAPLSQHGTNQATALAKAHADIQYIAILSSPLKRALATAEALQEAQNEPKPPIETSLLLREQHFGVAEGKSYRTEWIPGLTLEQHFSREIFPALRGRHLKFPGGESRSDLAERANEAIDNLLMPYVQSAIATGLEESHIAVVSHGLFIREVTETLLRRNAWNVEQDHRKGVSHLRNTAWARLVVEPMISPRNALKVRLLDYHRFEHLHGVVRQKAGIGSMAHDPSQRDIRTFFSTKSKGSSDNCQDHPDGDVNS